MRALSLAVLLAALLPCTLALADEDAGAPLRGTRGPFCTSAASVPREMAVENQATLEKVARALAATRLPERKTFDSVWTALDLLRDGVDEVHCTEVVLSPKQRAAAQAFESKTTALIEETRKLTIAEQDLRETIVVPLCSAHWGLDAARAAIARERANPSGVVDLAALHSAGQAIQQYQDEIAALTPQYAAARHHVYTGWQSEAACVAETEKPQQ